MAYYFCPFFSTISKTDAARIIQLDTQMFHHESWKPVYFGVRRPKVKVTCHKKNSAGEGLYTLVSAGFFQFSVCVCNFSVARVYRSRIFVGPCADKSALRTRCSDRDGAACLLLPTDAH